MVLSYSAPQRDIFMLLLLLCKVRQGWIWSGQCLTMSDIFESLTKCDSHVLFTCPIDYVDTRKL